MSRRLRADKGPAFITSTASMPRRPHPQIVVMNEQITKPIKVMSFKPSSSRCGSWAIRSAM
jgi:hypothetical protein